MEAGELENLNSRNWRLYREGVEMMVINEEYGKEDRTWSERTRLERADNSLCRKLDGTIEKLGARFTIALNNTSVSR